jgi:hypothetical protein
MTEAEEREVEARLWEKQCVIADLQMAMFRISHGDMKNPAKYALHFLPRLLKRSAISRRKRGKWTGKPK